MVKKENIQISVILDRETNNELKKEAERKCVSRSSIVKKIIIDYFKKNNN